MRIKKVILYFYQDLYTENENWRPNAPFEGLGSQESEDRAVLEGPFAKEEVLNAINTCSPYRSPGPDGLLWHFTKSVGAPLSRMS